MSFLPEAKRWIAHDTVTTRSNHVFAAFLERRFKALGFRTRRQSVRRGGAVFQNILAFRGPSGARPLLLNTHLDTVPPGPRDRWTKTGGNPWRATLKGGRLYGLGTADVKLNLLCQMEALRALGTATFHRPLVVAGTFGEESGLLGAKELIARWRGPKPFLALVGEPSEMKPIHRHRGYLVFEWTLPAAPLRGPFPVEYRILLSGVSAHSSTPELGENAIEKALTLLRVLERGREEAVVLSFDGGTAANQVPAEAALRVAASRPSSTLHRLAEGAASRRAPRAALPWRALAAAADGLRRSFLRPGWSTNVGRAETFEHSMRLTFDVRFPPEEKSRDVIAAAKKILTATGAGGKIVMERDNPGLSSDPKTAAARLVAEALAREGLPAAWTEKKTCTEAGLYSRWGVPAFVLGPGVSQGNIHRPNESVAMADLRRAVRFYETLVTSWCLS